MSEPKVLDFPPGSVLVLTEGEYSHFCVAGILVTIQDCNLPALKKEYCDSYKPKDSYDKPTPGRFPSWLVANGHAMPCESSEVNLEDFWWDDNTPPLYY